MKKSTALVPSDQEIDAYKSDTLSKFIFSPNN